MFELRPAIPPDLKKFRKAVTKRYGYYTLFLALLFILLVALFNYAQSKAPRQRSYRVGLPSWVISLGWTIALIWLVISQTMNDWTFLVKRLGRVAVALMPPTYLLTLRPTPLPKTLYLELLPFHKWCSRVIVLLALIHGVLYTWIYLQTGKLTKLLKYQNLSGIVALTAFLAMAISSIKLARRSSYQTFYAFHYILAWAVVPLVWVHSQPPSNGYMASCAAILTIQAAYRIKFSHTTRLPVEYVSPSLLAIHIPKHQLPNWLQSWSPGSHIRLSAPLSRAKTWIESSHPYTIASMPHDDNLILVIRKTQFQVRLLRQYAVFGTFNSLPAQLTRDAESGRIQRALLVIGGSGIAYGAPVMRFLKSHPGVQVKMVWAVRDVRDTKILKQLHLAKEFAKGEIEVYVTDTAPPVRKRDAFQSVESLPGNQDDDLDVTVDNLYCSGPSELEPLLLGRDADSVHVHGRPVLNMRLKTWLCGIESSEGCGCFDGTIDIHPRDKQGAYVISSGAERLVGETKRWANSSGFEFCQEEFAL